MKKRYLAGLLGASALIFYCFKPAPLAYMPPSVTVSSFVTDSSVVLHGSAISQRGISFVLWSQVSGPRVRIADSAAAVTSVSGAAPGTYVFELFATDEAGATSSAYDTVTVRYNPSFFSMR
ncbi:MAG TPA: hypothetical protein VL547_09840 [Dinghuibacter sp.]|uniref:PKD domain-containing protein n=1 Tax=Dinghuibacter sp. TaxID=2024697 RepID=UPI002CFD66C3|nr:hypothetical protein [Dinghuibacter sp.]HTJ12316.1 hypothetical protein [Dinghuibacter sp.]